MAIEGGFMRKTHVEAQPQPLLSVRSVSKIYRMGEVEVPALREVDLEVFEGEFLVILGPSGSGKSTLLNMIGGMDRPSSGQVLFGEQDLTRASDRQLTLFRRHQIGFVFQFFNLVPTLTAMENVELLAEITGGNADTRARDALHQVGLGHRADHFPGQLSGGEQQRVSIARALVKDVPLLLCDEPTGALDIDTGITILRVLRDTTGRGHTVLLVTHNSEIARMADRVLRLRDGHLVADEPNPSPASPEDLTW